MSNNDSKSSKDQNSSKDSSKKRLSDFQKDEFEEKRRESFGDSNRFYDFASSNKEQTIAIILLALGLLLLLLFDHLLGALMIGMVAGYYFAPEILYYLKNIGQIVSGHDQFRYIVLTAVLLSFFILAPGIFIGAIIVALFTQAMGIRR